MQHLKKIDWKKFILQGVLPCLLAVAVGFISRYQLELSDGVTESFLNAVPSVAPYTDAIEFALLIAILLVKPAGILGKTRKEKV